MGKYLFLLLAYPKKSTEGKSPKDFFIILPSHLPTISHSFFCSEGWSTFKDALLFSLTEISMQKNTFFLLNWHKVWISYENGLVAKKEAWFCFQRGSENWKQALTKEEACKRKIGSGSSMKKLDRIKRIQLS